MSTKSTTGSAVSSVQKWIIDENVEYQLHSGALKHRLRNESLFHGSIELSLRYPNLTAIGWDGHLPFSGCVSLLRVDLSGLPKLESIPDMAFSKCHHLVSVVFGEHSNITNLGKGSFQHCYALTSITLPNKLKVIENMAFTHCSSLERVVCNKRLKTIDKCAFQGCSKLEDV